MKPGTNFVLYLTGDGCATVATNTTQIMRMARTERHGANFRCRQNISRMTTLEKAKLLADMAYSAQVACDTEASNELAIEAAKWLQLERLLHPSQSPP